jgi:hypothetical protein
MKRTISALVFFSLTLPAFGQGVDPLIGTWKMNPAKSTATGFEIDKSLTLVFTKDGQDIALNLETIDAKNQMSKSALKHIYDGKPHPGIGDPNTDAIAYTRMGNTKAGSASKTPSRWRLDKV